MDKGADGKKQGQDFRVGCADLRIGPMKIEDVKEISEIERRSFEFPWSADSFREIALSQIYRSLVAKGPYGEIMGYMIYYIASDEGHVMNVAVNPEFRRRGVAEVLLDRVHGIFADAGLKSAYLELRRSNYPAFRLYKKKGYVYVGLRRGYYTDNMEDAILMRKYLR